MTSHTISIPEYCLVLLVGASGSGKSTFAARHFKPTEIISSDRCRAVVADDESDQSATADAFELVHFIAEKRLNARRLAVIDATNVRPEDRRSFVDLAKRYHALVVAFVFDMPEALCHERNAGRPERDFGRHVVSNHLRALKRGIRRMDREGIRFVYRFSEPARVDEAIVERQKLWVDKRDEGGPFDIIGDVHGCADELEKLLTNLGYRIDIEGTSSGSKYSVIPPVGRKVVFLGDLVDRGPRVPDTLRLAKTMVDAGQALCVLGNHEAKLVRKLKGRNVKLTHGLAESVAQIEAQHDGFVDEMLPFMDGLISHYVLDGGKLIVAHAGLREEMQNRSSGKVRSFALYGDTTGETDEFGLPVRHNWAAEYGGRAKVVYGHTPVPDAEWLNGTICIDTGCVFGGKLTALRYPEMELVEVPAAQVYCEPVRPIAAPKSSAATDDTQLQLSDVIGKRVIGTRLSRSVTIREEQAAAALEVMSRFAIDPRWLIHLPPTMSPSETSTRDGYLEHPDEALDYFRRHGVGTVICEEKHMGSRAVMVVCRDDSTPRKRFGVDGSRRGVVYSRTGRAFFPDREAEAAVIDRVASAASQAGWWDEFATDWFCLDAEVMPWSVKAQSLIDQQYAPVAAAAEAGLQAAVDALALALDRGVDVAGLAERFRQRQTRARAYRDAYNNYVWPVSDLDDLRIAPFHLLASEGAVHADKDHQWHMKVLTRLCNGDPALLFATTHRVVDLSDEAGVTAAMAWWEELTAAGGEGMVVKPLDFVARGKRGLVQPALKCRGREYLRIIYGPDYDAPENLNRLRQRGLSLKRSMALREFALGLESLQRFVDREPLSRVHECVFGVLAMETEPVDPRL